VSKKKKQQQAVQRAQQYVSGSKLQKSEVKKLESKGFSSKQIQSVAAGMKVGGKAQSRIDSKHSSTGGSSGGGGGGGPKRVQTVGTSRNVRVDSQGRAIANPMAGTPYGGGYRSGDPRLSLNKDQAKKVNKKLDKYGGSLVGGKGMAVSGYVTITDPGRRQQPKHGGGKIGGGKHQLAIYAPSAPAAKQPKSSGKGGSTKAPSGTSSGSRSSSGGSAPISVGGATGNYATVEKLEQEAPEAPNFYDTANSFPQNPNFSPTGAPGVGGGNGSSPIYWDRTAENLFSFSDRLKDHNRQTGQWLSNIAAQDRRESESYLQNFARALPPAPSADQANDSVLSFLEQANKRLGFGSTMGGVTV
jgi:hypothetical protein